MELSTRTLGDWLEHWALTTPDKEYIVYSDRNLRFTWKQFNERVDHMAKGLLAIGVAHLAVCVVCLAVSVRLRQNRCRGRNSKYQLQTGRTGIPLPELGHAHAVYRKRRPWQ